MRYSNYPEYIEPKIDSIQGIPAHWNQKKFRFLFSFGRGLGITKSDLIDKGVPCINYGEIHSKYGFEVVPEKQALKCVVEDYLEESSTSLLNKGDFVFADTSEDLEGSGNFSYLNSNTPTFAGYHTVIAKPTEQESSRFLAYFFDSLVYRTQIRKSVSGVKVFSITQNILKDSYVWLPPIDEQQKVAAFLDYKTQQIDQLIAKKKALIEKLEEKRIAVITQAVTKGLDKNVTLKPSGVDWLGDVPEHWEMTRFRFLLKDGYEGLKIGPFGSQIKSEELTNEGYKVYGQENVINNNFKLGHRFLDEEKFNELRVYEIFPGDILITMMGSSGNCQLAPKGHLQGIMDSHLIRLRTNYKMSAEFSKLLIDEAHYVKYQMLLLGKGSIMHGLNSSIIKSMNFCVPPMEEQDEILHFLSIEIGHIDKLKEVAETTINRLEEYRSALITSAVTGKIDVRNVQIPKEAA